MSRPSLRILLFLLAGLSGLKVWAQDHYQRAIYNEALLQAYGGQARLNCQKELTRIVAGKPASRLEGGEVVIGNTRTSVALWDVDNPLWDVRYRHPHILIKAQGGHELRCAYDLMAGLASVWEE